MNLGCAATPGHYQSLWLIDKGFYLFPLSATLQSCLSPCEDHKGFPWQHRATICSSGVEHPREPCVLGKDHSAQTTSVKSLVTLCSCCSFGICFLLLKVYKLWGFLWAVTRGGHGVVFVGTVKHWEEETLNSSKNQEEGKLSSTHSGDRSVLLSVSKKEKWFLVL